MSEDNKILRNVNKLLAIQEFKEGIELIKMQVPSFIDYHKTLFEEMKNKGYTEEQAFKFASDIIMKYMFFATRTPQKEEDEY